MILEYVLEEKKEMSEVGVVKSNPENWLVVEKGWQRRGRRSRLSRMWWIRLAYRVSWKGLFWENQVENRCANSVFRNLSLFKTRTT